MTEAGQRAAPWSPPTLSYGQAGQSPHPPAPSQSFPTLWNSLDQAYFTPRPEEQPQMDMLDDHRAEVSGEAPPFSRLSTPLLGACW